MTINWQAMQDGIEKDRCMSAVKAKLHEKKRLLAVRLHVCSELSRFHETLVAPLAGKARCNSARRVVSKMVAENTTAFLQSER